LGEADTRPPVQGISVNAAKTRIIMGNTNDEQQASSTSNGTVKGTGFSLSQEPLIHSETLTAEVAVAERPLASTAPDFEDLGDLPSTYDEDTLFLVARDPRWLFSYWDFDWAKVPNTAFRFGVRVFYLRLLKADGGEEATIEIRPEARNWYVPVSLPNTEYYAELGHFGAYGDWVPCVRSSMASTPPEALAAEALPAEFATVPAGLTFEQMLALVNEHMEAGESLLQAVARITGDGREVAFRAGESPTWSDDQRRLLAALLGNVLIDRMGLGSAEIDELLRKQLLEKLHSESASGLGPVWQRALEQPGGASSLFSGVTSWGGASWPLARLAAQRGFFMHVNAEIVFYGGTDPDATVWIDGQEIKLQPDGTFRYHFRLPDGEWAIPIVARSPDGVEQRSATLSFVRGTGRVGDVGQTAQPTQIPPEPMGRKG
jgi:uncharacterized protein